MRERELEGVSFGFMLGEGRYVLTRTSSRRHGSELEIYANQRHIVGG
jgi:hypothetical protein